MKNNPAKAFLRRYLALTGRVDALNIAIEQAMARAFDTGVTIKDVKVLSSPAEHDPMARDVCEAVDSCELLYQAKDEAAEALREILTAIDSLEDERQKEVLTLRYIAGLPFLKIKEKINYEEAQMYVIHGRALIGINKWLETHQKQAAEAF